MPISTGHKKVWTNTKPHRRPPQYIYHHCNVTPGLGLLVSACLLMLPMLGQVGEHLQLTTMYHMNNINQGGVSLCLVSFSPALLVLPSFNNVLPAMILQSRVVRLKSRCVFYTSSHSGVRHGPPILHLNLPSGLRRRVVGVVLVLLLLMSGDIETNPGPVGEFLC